MEEITYSIIISEKRVSHAPGSLEVHLAAQQDGGRKTGEHSGSGTGSQIVKAFVSHTKESGCYLS